MAGSGQAGRNVRATGRANLSRANLSHANLTGVNLTLTHLIAVDLTDAELGVQPQSVQT